MLSWLATSRVGATSREGIYDMNSVKLQILLNNDLSVHQVQYVEDHLRKIGAEITGRGAVTLSAVMPRQLFERTFSKQFTGEAGFVASPTRAADLPVPAELREQVQSISETPTHTPME